MNAEHKLADAREIAANCESEATLCRRKRGSPLSKVATAALKPSRPLSVVSHDEVKRAKNKSETTQQRATSRKGRGPAPDRRCSEAQGYMASRDLAEFRQRNRDPRAEDTTDKQDTEEIIRPEGDLAQAHRIPKQGRQVAKRKTRISCPGRIPIRRDHELPRQQRRNSA